MTTLRIGMVSMKSLFTDSDEEVENLKRLAINLDRHEWFIRRLAADGADFIGFPECSINGYRYSRHMLWLREDGLELERLGRVAAECRVHVGVGFAERDGSGRTWESQVILSADGGVLGRQRKHWLTGEKGFIEPACEVELIDILGVKMGISICADGSDFRYLQALAERGAHWIYGPHANFNDGTPSGWLRFRSGWTGRFQPDMVDRRTFEEGDVPMPTSGWMQGLGLVGTLCNHAGRYHPEWNPPVGYADDIQRFSSGVLFIDSSGEILHSKPESAGAMDNGEYSWIQTLSIPATPPIQFPKPIPC